MVFETVVATILNKALGSYVENLDASQMNLGIWGGNVVLNNLNLKDTALHNLWTTEEATNDFHKMALRFTNEKLKGTTFMVTFFLLIYAFMG
ncbi:hypothetical protein D918_05711 [Trichuris suis]|nr:hypothetical protein D918_05711 [Trichuris suis]